MSRIYDVYMTAGTHFYAVIRGGVKVCDCPKWDDYPIARHTPWIETERILTSQSLPVSGPEVFAVYTKAAEGLNFAMQHIPAWSELEEEQQIKWTAVADWANRSCPLVQTE